MNFVGRIPEVPWGRHELLGTTPPSFHQVCMVSKGVGNPADSDLNWLPKVRPGGKFVDDLMIFPGNPQGLTRVTQGCWISQWYHVISNGTGCNWNLTIHDIAAGEKLTGQKHDTFHLRSARFTHGDGSKLRSQMLSQRLRRLLSHADRGPSFSGRDSQFTFGASMVFYPCCSYCKKHDGFVTVHTQIGYPR